MNMTRRERLKARRIKALEQVNSRITRPRGRFEDEFEYNAKRGKAMIEKEILESRI